MDEPTNDLDVETLELLEELLGEYTGTLLLVSHDRDFLDNVVTSTLVMEGDGLIGDYVGGYSDSLRQRRTAPANAMAVAKASATAAATTPVAAAAPGPAVAEEAAPKRKLSYKEARELEQLPALIETLEQQVAALTEAMNDPAFYQRDSAAMTAHTAALTDAQAQLDAAYARWSELDR